MNELITTIIWAIVGLLIGLVGFWVWKAREINKITAATSRHTAAINANTEILTRYNQQLNLATDLILTAKPGERVKVTEIPWSEIIDVVKPASMLIAEADAQEKS
jgi:hypothetical protein